MRFVFVCLFLMFVSKSHAVEKVSFLSDDGLRITADVYLANKENPFIILLHQANYSRGEYVDIAPRLVKLGFNCIAIDLRSGDKINYIENETAHLAEKQNIPNEYLDAIADIEAAIKFSRSYTRYPVILFGSSYSASLSLMIASKNNQVAAVVAFSPGEYFRPEINVKDSIKGLNKPVFVASSKLEFPYAEELLSGISNEYVTFFKPDGKGIHGAKALWPNQQDADSYWFNLMLFLNQLK